ncbi:YTH domain-containing protein 1-like isoform X2 [Panonychus citri]|uniref:YTH domain-containing protein 1-like isoform X2 n=1 Tax=Panonychus citri TaxID=50023 RepID=UPI002306DF3D|nr:YTH domain-containing protein 1-like isoform X2 [Panonychus citri]
MILSRPLASLCFVNRFTLYRSLSIFSHSWNLNVNLFISSAFELINCDQYTSCFKEEKNVLDELLGTPEDDDLASELNSVDRKSGIQCNSEPGSTLEASTTTTTTTSPPSNQIPKSDPPLSSRKSNEESTGTGNKSTEKKNSSDDNRRSGNNIDKSSPRSDISTKSDKDKSRSKDTKGHSKSCNLNSNGHESGKKDSNQEKESIRKSEKTERTDRNSANDKKSKEKSPKNEMETNETDGVNKGNKSDSEDTNDKSDAEEESCSCEEHSSVHSGSSSPSHSTKSSPRPSRSPSDKSPPRKITASPSSERKRERVRDRTTKVIKKHRPKRYKSPSSSARKVTSHRDYGSLLKYFFRDAVYFVMKSNNHENVVLSKAKGVWSTPPQNEHKLNRAFKEFRNVILIFSIKESGKFQGFARLASESRHNAQPIQWVLPPGLSAKALGGIFSLDWICRKELSFAKTLHLFNPLNEGKPVKIARDGQEIDPRVGEELCRLFPADETADLMTFLKRMKKQTISRSKTSHSRPTSDHRSINNWTDTSTRRPLRLSHPPLNSYSNNLSNQSSKRKRSGRSPSPHLLPPPTRRVKRDYRDQRVDSLRERRPSIRDNFRNDNLNDYSRKPIYSNNYQQYDRGPDDFTRRAPVRPQTRERRHNNFSKYSDRRY